MLKFKTKLILTTLIGMLCYSNTFAHEHIMTDNMVTHFSVLTIWDVSKFSVKKQKNASFISIAQSALTKTAANLFKHKSYLITTGSIASLSIIAIAFFLTSKYISPKKIEHDILASESRYHMAKDKENTMELALQRAALESEKAKLQSSNIETALLQKDLELFKRKQELSASEVKVLKAEASCDELEIDVLKARDCLEKTQEQEFKTQRKLIDCMTATDKAKQALAKAQMKSHYYLNKPQEQASDILTRYIDSSDSIQ